MKEILEIICITILSTLLFSGVIYIATNLPEQKVYEEPIDFVRCREQGGFPIKSAWDHRLLDCKKIK